MNSFFYRLISFARRSTLLCYFDFFSFFFFLSLFFSYLFFALFSFPFFAFAFGFPFLSFILFSFALAYRLTFVTFQLRTGVKLYCAPMAKRIADRAIQVLGGNGYVAEYKVLDVSIYFLTDWNCFRWYSVIEHICCMIFLTILFRFSILSASY